MKTMTIPASEASRFWNILRRFCKGRKISAMFKNGNAIFTAEIYGGASLSYSAKYDGPDDYRTFCLWQKVIKHKSNNVVFKIDEANPSSDRLWNRYQSDGISGSMNVQDKQEFDDISEDGIETPADMPKIFGRLIKIRRGAIDYRNDRLYFESASQWEKSFAISTDGIGMIHARFPLLGAHSFSIPIFPMKCLPGSGLVSFYEKGNRTMLCYQAGGWLYTTATDIGLFRSSEVRKSLLSPPDQSSPVISLDKSDFEAIMIFTTTWRAWEWARKKPIATFKTNPQGQISVEFLYSNSWYGDKPVLSPILLEKTKWNNGSTPEFSACLMELRNAMSAGFSEFSVEVSGPTTTIKSESKGMKFVASCIV